MYAKLPYAFYYTQDLVGFKVGMTTKYMLHPQHFRNKFHLYGKLLLVITSGQNSNVSGVPILELVII